MIAKPFAAGAFVQRAHRQTSATNADTIPAWAYRLGFGLAVIGVACRLFRSWLDLPIWGDEASLALNFVERDYSGLTCELGNRQIAPLLFLWLEKTIFDIAGPSVWFLRLPPLLAGLGGLLVFRSLARRCLSPFSACLALGFMAVAQSPIELANTIKPYSLDLLLSVVLFWLAARLRQEPEAGVTWLRVLALLTPVAVFLSYPIVFVAGSISLMLAPLAYRHGKREWRLWYAAFNFLLVASFVTHFLFVGRTKLAGNTDDLQGYMKSFWNNGFPHGAILEHSWWLMRAHIGKLLSYPVECKAGGAIGLILVLLGVRALLQEGKRWLVALCLAPYGLHLIAAFLQRYPYGMNQRLEQDLLPGFCMMAGAGLATLIERLAATPRARTKALVGASVVFTFVGIGNCIVDYRWPYRTEEALCSSRVIEHLRREMRADDLIVIRGDLKKCPTCVQWHLAPLASRIDLSAELSSSLRQQTNGRIWIIETREDHVPIGTPEPNPSLSDEELSEFSETIAWQSLDHWRFRASMPGARPYVFRLYCDLYLLNKPRSQAARN